MRLQAYIDKSDCVLVDSAVHKTWKKRKIFSQQLYDVAKTPQGVWLQFEILCTDKAYELSVSSGDTQLLRVYHFAPNSEMRLGLSSGEVLILVLDDSDSGNADR